jgi:hypothetical protein
MEVNPADDPSTIQIQGLSMSIQPSSSGEVIKVGPLGGRLETTQSSTLIETDQVKVIRMVMKTGKALVEHQAPGLIMV